MKIELTGIDNDSIVLVNTLRNLIVDDYGLTDCERLIMFAQGKLQHLFDCDIYHTGQIASNSAIRAAFDNDVKPLFGGEWKPAQT